MDKRSFLKSAGLIGLGSIVEPGGLAGLIESVSKIPSAELAEDESFWKKIRAGYRLKPGLINLENGYYCFLPQQILESQIKHLREINYQGSYYMRTVQFENKKKMADKLASLGRESEGSATHHPQYPIRSGPFMCYSECRSERDKTRRAR